MGDERINLSIIMPVFNEKATFEKALGRLIGVDFKSLGITREIIIVDDGSTDGTQELLKRYQSKNEPANDIKVIFHEKNMGKGAAIRTGFAHASGEVVTVHDADLEYNPDDFKELLKPILAGKYDVVYGSRFIKRTEYAHLRFKIGNILFSFLISMLFGARITDSYTCYKMFKRSILDKFVLESNGFEIEAELTIKFLKAGYRILEMPISYKPRSIKQGKKIGWKDACIGLFTILKHRFTK